MIENEYEFCMNFEKFHDCDNLFENLSNFSARIVFFDLLIRDKISQVILHVYTLNNL